MAKKRGKKKSIKVKPTIYIMKKRVNFEVRFDYDKMFLNFLKSLPKGHMSTRVDRIKKNGVEVDDWVRVVKPIQIGNLISFMRDNSYNFELQNVTADEVKKLVAEYKGRQKRINDVLKARVEGFDVSNEDYSFLNEGYELFDYQKRGLKFIEMNNGKAIIGDQPGVGKTLQVMSYAAKHKLKTLVICPASLKLMWRREVERFTEEKAHIFKFKPTKKSGIINHPKDDCIFHVTNYESVSSFIKTEYKHKCQGQKLDPVKMTMKNCGLEITDIKKKYTECPECKGKNTFRTRAIGLQYFQTKTGEFIDPEEYDLIVLDESHRIKERTTEWTKIITKAFACVPKKVLISGTVAKNRPIELFAPLNFLDPEVWNSFHEFGKRYSAGFEDTFGWSYDGASNLEELYERMAPFYLRRRKKDVLTQLPPKTFTEIPVMLTPKQEREYTKLEEEMKIIENADGSVEEKEQSFLEKVHKLKSFNEEIKLNECKEFVQDVIDSGDKVVIFFNYLDTGKKMKELFGDACVIHDGTMSAIDKAKAVSDFQDKKDIHVFGGTIDSAGVGITLTAANKLIFIGQGWDPASMEQAEDRIHRASTTHDNVQIITYLVEGTIDRVIHDMIRSKAQVISKIQDNEDYSIKVNTVDQGSNLMELLSSYLSRRK